MADGSLCNACLHVREVTSARGSRFLLCRKSQDDQRYAKYPPQPVIRCAGFMKAEQQENGGQENGRIRSL